MDIAQFIRVFRNNLLLLIAIPLLLALVVFYFTRNQSKIYESEAIIYTGITTGYSIESTAQRPTDFFSTSAQFDNLINIINSRQTIVESAIMLLAQNLSLDKFNAQYISRENFVRLKQMVPKQVQDMVVVNGKAGIEREKELQIKNLEREIKNLEKEINKKKNRALVELNGNGNSAEFISQAGVNKNNSVSENAPDNDLNQKTHIVQPGETLLSVSRKYGVSLSKLRELNNFDQARLSVGQRIIVSSSNNGFNSSGYSEKVVNLYEEDDLLDDIVSMPAEENAQSSANQNDFDRVYDLFSETDGAITIEKDPIIPPSVNKDDFDKTILNFTNYYNSSDTNFIYELLHYGAHPHYSIASIQTLQIYRINNSDLVRLIYTSDDPGICQQTLKIISQTFVKNYKALKENQTDLVVAYFKRQVDSADLQLQAAEDRLLKFNKKNNIINYAEQTKYIAAQKEDLDLYYQNEQVRMAQASASLRELETKLTRRDSIYLKSDMINQKRKQFADISEKILINEIAEDYNQLIGNEIARLRDESDRLRDEIKLYVDQLYLYSHSTQGVPISSILEEWLKNALIYEEAKASLVVLSRRKMDFVRTYQRFAPLGAMLKRIEREIAVAEQSYHELLRSLNLAKMRQQNLKMATNIRIVDPPYFPLNARASKAKYLVVAAFLIGFLLVAFIILILEYFDASLRNPERVAKTVNMKLAGAYPYISSNIQMQNMVMINNRLIEMIIQNLKLKLTHNAVFPAQKPYFILFFSTQDNTGKTFLSHKIANKLRTYGEKVLVLNFYNEHDLQADEEDFNMNYPYQIKENFVKAASLKDIVDKGILRKENYPYDYIFLEIPSIIFNDYPMELMQDIDASLMILKASSRWNKADLTAVDILESVLREKPMVVLNEAQDYAIEEIISGIKIKKTSPFWKKVKYTLSYPTRIRLQVKEN
ncbi:MAG: LysM peptidoglycan-binding domain-containing protein [Bacteroidetes bacterium]|jgi:succinoglycan biosynthesis transport protein ExoP|nr:LysM peptidoglycan-binding domain-containing protein [Bacteroidota bacterium]